MLSPLKCPQTSLGHALRRLLIVAIATAALAACAAPDAAPAAAAAEFEKVMALDAQAQRDIEDWEQAFAANRLANDAVYEASLRLKIKERLEAVAKAYEAAISKYPNHAPTRLAYGSLLRENGKDREALAQWEEARRLAPENPAVWNNLGNYYGQNGPATNAFVCLSKAMELNPRQPLYHHNLGRCLYLYQEEAAVFYGLTRRQVVEKAQGLFRRALELQPDNFRAATDLAQSYYSIQLPLTGHRERDLEAARKLSDEAEKAWLAALKLASQPEEQQGIRLHLARLQISIGRLADARENLRAVTHSSLAETKQDLEKRLAAEEKKNVTPPAPSATNGEPQVITAP